MKSFVIRDYFRVGLRGGGRLVDSAFARAFAGYKVAILSLFVALSLSAIKAEDRSGLFIGAQVTYGDLLYSEDNKINVTNNTNKANGYRSSVNTGPGYGILGGYNLWFNPFFGMRAYGSVFYNDFKFYTEEFVMGSIRVSGGKDSTYQINLSANIDAMLNFFVRRNFSAGFFVGGSVAMQYWNSSRLDAINELYQSYMPGGKNHAPINTNPGEQRLDDNRIALGVAVNAGVRANFYGFHTLEAGARIPFRPTTIIDGYLEKTNLLTNSSMSNIIKVQQSWNVFVRYIFNF